MLDTIKRNEIVDVRKSRDKPEGFRKDMKIKVASI